MAIIGKIDKLEDFLKDKELNIIFNYFKEALDKNTKTHKRIFGLPVDSFEKVKLTDNIFALEQVFYTKNRNECFIESHKKYIDFQLVLKGREQMEYIDISKLEIEKKYDDNKDLIVYKIVNNTSKFLLEKEDLAIFFPDDAHIGLPKFNESELVYKTVVKFPVKDYYEI